MTPGQLCRYAIPGGHACVLPFGHVGECLDEEVVAAKRRDDEAAARAVHEPIDPDTGTIKPSKVPPHMEGKVASSNCTGIELGEIHPALLEAAKICAAKARDYGQEDDARRKYFPCGDASYFTMLWTKLERVRSLRIDHQRNSTYEGARDSLIDLINYASFYVAYLDEERSSERVMEEIWGEKSS